MKALLLLGMVGSWLVAFAAIFLFSQTVFGQTIGGIFMLNGTLCLIGWAVVEKLDQVAISALDAAKALMAARTAASPVADAPPAAPSPARPLEDNPFLGAKRSDPYAGG